VVLTAARSVSVGQVRDYVLEEDMAERAGDEGSWYEQASLGQLLPCLMLLPCSAPLSAVQP
jgi:hypothetical protein